MEKEILLNSIQNLEKTYPRKNDYVFSNSNALILNLSEEKFQQYEIPQSFLIEYLGGKGLALRLWAEFAGENVDKEDSYEADNPIVFANPAMINSGMKETNFFSIVFRSPITKGIISCMSSVSFGQSLDALGYKALILIGRLRRQTVIKIGKDGVSFRVSERYVGKNVSETESLLELDEKYTSLTIGTAGELKIPFSSVVSEGQSIDRGGLGYVFGLKNVKSIIIQKNEEIHQPGDFDGFHNFSKKFHHKLEKSRWSQLDLLKEGSRKGWIPVGNFSRRVDPRIFHLTGDEVCRKYSARKTTIFEYYSDCRHISKDSKLFPGYSTIAMLGANLNCFDMEDIIKREKACLDIGIDPVSTGNILGWFSTLQNLGDNKSVLNLIENIGSKSGIGAVLSKGVREAAKELGNQQKAYHTSGLECGPFDFRGNWAQSLLELTNSFLLLPDYMSKNKTPKNISNSVVDEENLILGMNNIGFSSMFLIPFFEEHDNFFTKLFGKVQKKLITIKKLSYIAIAFSSYSGIDLCVEEILDIGKNSWNLLNKINQALGINIYDIDIPNFFLINPNSSHKQKITVPWHKLKYSYLNKRVIS